MMYDVYDDISVTIVSKTKSSETFLIPYFSTIDLEFSPFRHSFIANPVFVLKAYENPFVLVCLNI